MAGQGFSGYTCGMNQFYIQTQQGDQGPYSADQVLQMVQSGSLMTSAPVFDRASGRTYVAAEVAGMARPQPAYGQHQGYQQAGFGGQPYPPPGGPAPYAPPMNPYGMQQQVPGYNVPRQTSGLAIASLVLALSGFLCGLTPIGGLICGIMALKETGPGGGKDGRGLAIAGIAISSIILLLVLAYFVLVFAFMGAGAI